MKKVCASATIDDEGEDEFIILAGHFPSDAFQVPYIGVQAS
jgi:hypothetical protein